MEPIAPPDGDLPASAAEIDIVVVSYNSRETLRTCVASASEARSARIFVVDNASTDGSLASIADLDVVVLAREENEGFATACNHGWRVGTAPYVLFLNPDAQIDGESIHALAGALAARPSAGIVAPKILGSDGSLQFSQRRFPTIRSTFSQALFLHRLFPQADWSDEVVRAARAYETESSPDWVSGACLVIRRSLLESIGGWDDSFFLYSEDTDLCRRVRAAGFDVLYVPAATAVHVGGQSAPRANLLPLLAESRVRYARKHERARRAFLQRMGVALSALSHLLVARRQSVRAGHARALRTALRS
jgi:N-acetylglucosaminyl-diphospho-decaprenol L-rhamnosyltransferase